MEGKKTGSRQETGYMIDSNIMERCSLPGGSYGERGVPPIWRAWSCRLFSIVYFFFDLSFFSRLYITLDITLVIIFYMSLQTPKKGAEKPSRDAGRMV